MARVYPPTDVVSGRAYPPIVPVGGAASVIGTSVDLDGFGGWHGATYDKGDRIVQLDADILHGIASFDTLGTPRFGHRRLNYSERIATADATARLSGAITDGGEGNGIAFPLTGGWGSADWEGACPNVIWSLDDIFGCPLGGALGSAFAITVIARAAILGPTDEWYAGLAIVNDTVLTGATVDGMGVGVGGTGAVNNAGVRAGGANGAGSLNYATTDVATVGARAIIGLNGVGATSGCYAVVVASFDASGILLQTTSSGGIANFGNPSRLYLAGFAGRSAAGAAGAVTVKADFYVSPILRSPLLTATP